MSQNFEKLKDLLLELFQLNQPDLDFGIYRVMHAKSSEVKRFLENELPPQVQQAFEQYRPADKARLKEELSNAIKNAESLGIDPETSPKVKELRKKISEESVDISTLEGEVYDHLFSFFRRYYSDGDFLPKRVYKQGVYAIPYEGEEVKLCWANSDQYYIKTNEYLRDYTFLLSPGRGRNSRIHFRIVDAEEGEHGNVKPVEGKDRVFVLAPDGKTGHEFLKLDNGELVISFEYRPAKVSDWPEEDRETKKKAPSQKDLILFTSKRILAVDKRQFESWITELGKPHIKVDGEKADYTRLESHLRRYTARNTFDYFIHKDLGGFLRRELDFYIKNEVMHLDDIEKENAARVEQYLSKIKVIRTIAGKIIVFLSQLEDFQKKLWLKKKFVIETNYCITLDRIPEELYPIIAANERQCEEWKRLFTIQKIRGFSEPMNVNFLKDNDKLVVDTSFFDSDFKFRLISSIEDLDEKTNGLLVHSDNFQALELLGKRYSGKVKCVYIDPPYNTNSSRIPYKNDYQHSTWIAMMYDRLAAISPALSQDGAIFVSIDKTERTGLQFAMDDVFGSNNKIEELIWSMNTTNSQVPNYSTNHEYVLVYAKDRTTAEKDPEMFREPKPGYEEVMVLVARLNPSYPRISQIEEELRSLYEQHKIEFREEIESKGWEWEDEKGNDPWKGIFNYSHAEYRNEKGVLIDAGEAKKLKAKIWIWQEGDASMPATKQSATTRDPDHPNWRFYNPLHPTTGKPCPHPKSGWKFAYNNDADSPDRRSFTSLDRDNRIAFGPDETKVPRLKRFLHEVETNIGKSVFQDYSDGEKQTSAMFGKSGVFLAPKHSDFVSRFIIHAAKQDSTILDCFGGSGSTAHAVIKLNREDGGNRKFVLVEVNEYFDTVMKPRILKTIFSSNWRSGEPKSPDGISSCIKTIRLESYEDTLNNLEIRRTSTQQTLIAPEENSVGSGFKEQYLLQYMLDVETRGSQSLLNLNCFSDPFSYRLKVKRPGSEESRELDIDLPETFNYLVGLTVRHVSVPELYNAEFERDNQKRLRLIKSLKSDINGSWYFRTVRGTLPDGRGVLIIWRNRPGKEIPEGIEKDNLVLNEWFRKSGFDEEKSFDLVYVNGDNILANLKKIDDLWKVRLIDEDFHKLMFGKENP